MHDMTRTPTAPNKPTQANKITRMSMAVATLAGWSLHKGQFGTQVLLSSSQRKFSRQITVQLLVYERGWPEESEAVINKKQKQT